MMSLKEKYIEACRTKAEIKAELEFEAYISQQNQGNGHVPEPPEDDGSELLTAKEAAEFMKVSIGTVRAWSSKKNGRLKSHGEGKAKRFTKSACRRALKAAG